MYSWTSGHEWAARFFLKVYRFVVLEDTRRHKTRVQQDLAWMPLRKEKRLSPIEPGTSVQYETRRGEVSVNLSPVKYHTYLTIDRGTYESKIILY